MKRFRKAIRQNGDSLENRYATYLYYKMQFESPYNDRLDKRNAPEQLRQVFEALDIFHLMTTLVQVCEDLYRSGIIEEPSTIAEREQQQEKILEQTAPLANRRYPLIHLYRELILLKKTDSAFPGLCRAFGYLVLYRKLELVSLPEQNKCIRYLLNYCAYRNNQGDRLFLQVRQNIEHWGLLTDLLLVNGVLPDSNFLNAGLTAAGLKDFDKIEKLIDRYGSLLPQPVQVSAIALVRAYSFFFQDKFEAAADELDQVSVKSYFYSIQKHLLAVRVGYYRLLTGHMDIDKMYNVLQNARLFFRRNNYPVPPARRQSYLDMVLILERIVDYRVESKKRTPKQLKRIQRHMRERKPALSKWLEEVIADLTKNGTD